MLDPDRAFALTHVPHAVRPALAALWALDQRLGSIVVSTTQPMVGQMRMTWWHEALTTLQAGVQRGEPILDALAEHVVGSHDIAGPVLARLVEGWEVLLDPLPFEEDVLQTYGEARGDRLFTLSAQMLGQSCDNGAGRGWALTDFALRCSDPGTGKRAGMLARQALAKARIGRLPRALRVLARFASNDLRHGVPVPRTFWRLIASIR
ncbi:MAG: squalene/phytoene synthase family protein [Sphingomonadales bacterium]